MDNIFDTDRKEISGPINVLRMEGQIEDQVKVIYLFMNKPSEIENQTECLNIYSQTVDKYLVNTFYNLKGDDRFYDLFVEMDVSQYQIDWKTRDQIISSSNLTVPRSVYLDRIVRLVQSSNQFDSRKKKSEQSLVFHNVRLHYLNITEQMVERIILPLIKLQEIMNHYPIDKRTDIDPRVYDILENVKLDISRFERVYQTILNQPSAIIDEPFTQFARYLRKLLYSYQSTFVQKIIVNYVHLSFDRLTSLTKQIDETIKLLITTTYSQENPSFTYADGITKYKINLTQLIIETRGQQVFDIRVLLINAINIIANISDTYLLRRLLDKKYITHSIVYSSYERIIKYVQTLVDNFDFKISHSAYASEDNVNDLNKTIHQRLRNKQSIDDLLAYPRMSQCSDISDFPDNFE